MCGLGCVGSACLGVYVRRSDGVCVLCDECAAGVGWHKSMDVKRGLPRNGGDYTPGVWVAGSWVGSDGWLVLMVMCFFFGGGACVVGDRCS